MSTVPASIANILGAYMGEILALGTALIWAFAVILFKKSGETVHPIALNLFKGTLAGLLIPPTMLLMGFELFRDVPVSHYLVMLGGGAIGLGIADTLFFMSLNRLGAARSAIVDCLYSPSIIFFSIFLLGERLNIWQTIGVVLIVLAVLVGNREEEADPVQRKDLMWGVVYGLLAMFTMAFSIVGIKPWLDHSPLLWSMELRLIGGNIMLLLMLPFYKNRRKIIKSAFDPKGIRFMLPGSFFGTYIALILWLAGMKFSQASVASALNQTSNIFIFIFAAILLKERITRERLLGIFLGVGGVLLVTFTQGIQA